MAAQRTAAAAAAGGALGQVTGRGMNSPFEQAMQLAGEMHTVGGLYHTFLCSSIVSYAGQISCLTALRPGVLYAIRQRLTLSSGISSEQSATLFSVAALSPYE